MKALSFVFLYEIQKLCLTFKLVSYEISKFPPTCFLGLLLIMTSSFSKAINGNAVTKSSNVNLKYVFEKENSATDKYILKLYDNNTYEFLHFTIANKNQE